MCKSKTKIKNLKTSLTILPPNFHPDLLFVEYRAKKGAGLSISTTAEGCDMPGSETNLSRNVTLSQTNPLTKYVHESSFRIIRSR